MQRAAAFIYCLIRPNRSHPSIRTSIYLLQPKQHEGTVVAIGSGRASSSKSSSENQYTSVSATSEHQVQLLATSAGFGFCQGITKQGERCKRAVDKMVSPFCEWHVLSQARQVKHDLRAGAAIGAAAAAKGGGMSGLSSGVVGSGSGGGGGSIDWPGGGSGSCGVGVGGGGFSSSPGAAAFHSQSQLNPLSQGPAPLSGPTHQERLKAEKARLMANRQRLAQQLKQRGGLPAIDYNRTRPPSPPRQCATNAASVARDPLSGGGGAGAAKAAVQTGARQRAGAGGGSGSGSAAAEGGSKASATKRAKLLTGLGIAARPSGGPAPPQQQQQQQQPAAAGSRINASAAAVAGGGAARSGQRGAAAAPSRAVAQFAAAFGKVAEQVKGADPAERCVGR